jgi:protein neuralized
VYIELRERERASSEKIILVKSAGLFQQPTRSSSKEVQFVERSVMETLNPVQGAPNVTIRRCVYCAKLTQNNVEFCQGSGHQYRHSRCALRVVYDKGGFSDTRGVVTPSIAWQVRDFLDELRSESFSNYVCNTVFDNHDFELLISSSIPTTTDSNDMCITPTLDATASQHPPRHGSPAAHDGENSILIPAEKITASDSSSRSCVLCLDNVPHHASYPCGHMILCNQCVGERNSTSIRICPICRTPTEKLIRIYL